MKIRLSVFACALCFFAGLPMQSVGQAQYIELECQERGGYGPFDYTDPANKQSLFLVESAHFTPSVARLISGNAGRLGGDIDYTIRAFPNHHPALDALSRLGYRTKSHQPPDVLCSIEGYFERAIRYKPDDATVHMLYGIHFSRWGKSKESLEQFQIAEKLAPNSPNILYNLGLAYFEQKDYERARDYAVKAYDKGFPSNITGLQEKLKKIGKWQALAQ
jgi:tetratricopeptide (TPR) repeat protein